MTHPNRQDRAELDDFLYQLKLARVEIQNTWNQMNTVTELAIGQRKLLEDQHLNEVDIPQTTEIQHRQQNHSAATAVVQSLRSKLDLKLANLAIRHAPARFAIERLDRIPRYSAQVCDVDAYIAIVEGVLATLPHISAESNINLEDCEQVSAETSASAATQADVSSEFKRPHISAARVKLFKDLCGELTNIRMRFEEGMSLEEVRKTLADLQVWVLVDKYKTMEELLKPGFRPKALATKLVMHEYGVSEETVRKDRAKPGRNASF
jgi:hypothetical protein